MAMNTILAPNNHAETLHKSKLEKSKSHSVSSFHLVLEFVFSQKGQEAITPLQFMRLDLIHAKMPFYWQSIVGLQRISLCCPLLLVTIIFCTTLSKWVCLLEHQVRMISFVILRHRWPFQSGIDASNGMKRLKMNHVLEWTSKHRSWQLNKDGLNSLISEAIRSHICLDVAHSSAGVNDPPTHCPIHK